MRAGTVGGAPGLASAWLPAALLFFALAPGPGASAAEEPFAVQTLSLDGRAVAAEIADLDGDGRGDLLCIAFLGLPPREAREIHVFYAGKDGTLPTEPDTSLPLPPGTAAYDLAELDARPGLELILLRRDRLTLLSFPERTPTSRDLPVGTDTMAIVSDERGVDRLQIAQPGLGPPLRLLVPALGRALLLSAEGERLATLEVGARANYYVPQRPGPVFAESEMEIYLDHPRQTLGDVDGDGRADLVSTTRHEIRVFLQDDEGRLPSQADRRLALDRVALRDHVRNSGAVRVEPADFDGDGRLDLLIQSSHGGFFDSKSELGIHLNRGGTWDLDHPDQAFHSESGLTTAQAIDLDGDGRLELVFVKIPAGVLEIVELLLTRAIDVEVSVHRQEPGGDTPFSETPWHGWNLGVALSFETFRPQGFVPTLTVDVNGDGFIDHLGSGRGDELEVRLGGPEGGYTRDDGIQALDTGGRIRFGDIDADGLLDFVLYDARRPDAPVRIGVNRGVLAGTVRRPTLDAPDEPTPSAREPERSDAPRSEP